MKFNMFNKSINGNTRRSTKPQPVQYINLLDIITNPEPVAVAIAQDLGIDATAIARIYAVGESWVIQSQHPGVLTLLRNQGWVIKGDNAVWF